MATYTGRLRDIGIEVLTSRQPRLTVRPEVEAWGDNGLVSSARKVVNLNASTGEFTMELVPSRQLKPARGGQVGVKYIIEVALFDETIDGGQWIPVIDQWTFSAWDGGGPIADMGPGPVMSLFIGPPWPVRPRPGAYYDTGTADLGYFLIGVNQG